jgi:hypothetical protein
LQIDKCCQRQQFGNSAKFGYLKVKCIGWRGEFVFSKLSREEVDCAPSWKPYTIKDFSRFLLILVFLQSRLNKCIKLNMTSTILGKKEMHDEISKSKHFEEELEGTECYAVFSKKFAP